METEMAEKNEPLSKDKERARQLPPLGEYVWVQCQRYTTIAYRDAKGVWRSLGRGKKLSRITKVKWPEHWPIPAC
jgi:hypothetical protein